MDRLLCKQTGLTERNFSGRAYNPPYLPDYIWIHPNRPERPCTTGVSWQEHLQKLLTWTKISSKSIFWKLHPKEGYSNKGVDMNITNCYILLCLTLKSIETDSWQQILFTLYCTAHKWFQYNFLFLKSKIVFKSQERALSHLYGTSNTVTVSKMFLIFLQL